MKIRLTFLFAFAALALAAQSTFTIQKTLAWPAEPFKRTSPATGRVTEVWPVEGCLQSEAFPTLPVFAERFELAGKAKIEAELTAATWEPFPKKAAPEDAQLTANPLVSSELAQVKNEFFGWVKFVPVRRAGSGFERATSFTLTVRVVPEPTAPTAAADRGGPKTYTSVLTDGDVYKFGVAASGMYKLDFNFLKNDLKISNLESIDPRTLKLYGNGGAMLPERADFERADDLLENAIQIVGEDDGKFDASDYILFYAVGPAPWTYRPSTTDPEITIRPHLYETHAYYFLKVSAGAGARVPEQNPVDGAGNFVSQEFDDVRRLEEEKVNLLDFFQSTQGSGKRFWGDYFFQTKEKDYSANFDFGTGVNTSKSGRLRAEFAGRSGQNTSVTLTADGTAFTRTIFGVAVSDPEATFASNVILAGPFQPKGNKIAVRLDYPFASEQREGWLDYIEINVRRRLELTGNFLEFRDLETLTHDASTFQLAGAGADVAIWDITNPQAAKRQKFDLQGNTASFGAATRDVLRNYIAFKTNANNFGKPEKVVGKIENQNYHALDNLHAAIIYHSEFEEAAKRLADHRRSFSKLDIALVDVEKLYNEFSSGMKDPTAIRDFARMLLERNPKFDYLLLLGDGSFDPKNNTKSENNPDFVPVFETFESFSPIYSYPSDDYFGLLSDGEGGALTGALDIAVGRIPCNTPDEAEAVVEKIIAYDNAPETLGDWHLRLLYIADDEDTNAHINQADKLATAAENTERWFNPEKVYLDAYQQVATSAGARFPDAKSAINSNIFKGQLITQYIGHGGPRGWAQERVIDNSDIASWDNENRYTFIITATCTFGGYDDPFTVSGGEQALLKVRSGAVGLFTTVRPVYINDNNELTNAIQSVIFKKVNGWYRSTGDILKDGKNNLTFGFENARRFTLLGDPAMYLALPEYRVATTKINGKSVQPGGVPTDTLRALQPASIEGIVTDTLGNPLPNFNGKVYMTVFDKKQTLSTLGQDPTSPVRTFAVRRNTLFKGSATATNGAFKIEFIVPKDIDYAFGPGKISFYAENGTPLDAAGWDTDFVVGGNANQIKDDTPPLVQVFMNTDAFVSGGITDDAPKILVKCADDHGMNVTGSSLGHDLVAVLDDNVQESIVLNDFYESEQDNYRRGQALYPLKNIAPGRHTIRVKGWDIANNSGEGYTEFVVAEDGATALAHVLNYPNPFTTNTSFQFEHNLAGQMLDVQISIFTVAGRLVKTILHTAASADGYRVTDIAWDGKDDYGDQLAKGVYLYRVKVRGTDLTGQQ
ncbi:MAG: type IX secretion system sortase PorU, partial [Saprospiraceae bacterium]